MLQAGDNCMDCNQYLKSNNSHDQDVMNWCMGHCNMLITQYLYLVESYRM